MDLEPIGTLSSCYKEKFGVPRQSGLVEEARAVLTIDRARVPRALDAFRDLETFSHVWVIFHFHEIKEWKALVRPPRLDGKEKVGVFSSRSPHRPNPIGLSVVKLEKIEFEPEVRLFFKGGDFLDGTPVLDVKPYLPYCDSIPQASTGWTDKEFRKLEVHFSPAAAADCARLQREGYANLEKLIVQTLELDPRPAFQTKETTSNSYGMRLWDFDIHFTTTQGRCEVQAIQQLES